MARLSRERALELIKVPQNRDKIAQAINHEERLLFHCEPFQEASEMPMAFSRFLEWVSNILTPASFERFKVLLTSPVDTVETTETIFDELSKILEADDKYIKSEFVTPEFYDDFAEYAQKIGDNEFWEEDAFEAMKTAINSIMVIDLPADQTTERPEPYYYLLSIDRVHSIDFTKKGVLEYVIFRNNKELICIDEEFYRVYARVEEAEEFSLKFERQHSVYSETGEAIDGLGYCPADSFWHSPIAKSNHVNKKGPITNALGKLDWLLFWRTSKKYLDTYGAWPIFVSYKSKCEYRDEEGNICLEGFINYDERTDNGFTPRQKACPACSARKTFGPGTWWQADPPADKDDVDLLKNPVVIVEMSNDKLEYAVSEIQRLEDEVYRDCVGWDGEALNKQAVNENQVSANFESRQSVLDRLRKQFEKIRKFTGDTWCRYRYGEYFLRSTVDYGSEYFLKTPEDLTEQYKLSKDAGLPTYMVSNIRKRISRTANRNNPEQALRDEILSQLEPYPDVSLDKLVTLQVPTMDELGFIMKLNFNTFIQRFEREQMNIVEFGSLIDFNTKIDKILLKLTEYAKQQQKTIPRDVEGGASKPQV